jgi:hypothetical protein
VKGDTKEGGGDSEGEEREGGRVMVRLKGERKRGGILRVKRERERERE